MAKMFGFFVLVFVFGQAFSFTMDGERAFAQTSLSSAITASDTTLTVASTSGFRSAGEIIIGAEQISYTGTTATTFTGVTRGSLDTEPTSHRNGEPVYSESQGYLNQVIGYNVLQSVAGSENFFVGLFRGAKEVPSLIKNIFAKLVMWDYRFLDGQASPIRLILFSLSAVMVMSMILTLTGRPG